MELEKMANGIWKGRIGVPEQHTPVAMRRFPMQEKALERMTEAGLPRVAESITVRQNRRGMHMDRWR